MQSKCRSPNKMPDARNAFDVDVYDCACGHPYGEHEYETKIIDGERRYRIFSCEKCPPFCVDGFTPEDDAEYGDTSCDDDNCRLHTTVRCNLKCGAKRIPSTTEELEWAYIHWKCHGAGYGCSHGC